MRLYTIGYEKAALGEFVATLRRAGVERVIDVRDRPLSRRPGFSKRMLAASLEESGIGYVHLKGLGTPPEGREANKKREWDRFWHIVDEKLATGEGELDLQRAADLAKDAPSALLCLEADWKICHRSRVAEILTRRHGFTVEHLAVG
jgi:uncharacterized protein (DUF488 family)